MKQQMDVEASNKMRNMSFVCACLVVFIYLGVVDSFGSSAWWFSQIMAEGLCRIAVPYFFITSGYFCMRSYAVCNITYGQLIRAKFYSLLIPYFLCCTLFLLFSKAMLMSANAVAGRLITDNILDVSHFLCWYGLAIREMPFCVPLWFLRTLFFLFVLSPMLAKSVKKFGIWFVILMFVGDMLLGNSVELPILGCSTLLYFSLGLWLLGQDLDFRGGRACLVLGIALMAIATWGAFISCSYVQVLRKLSYPLLIIAMWSLIPSYEWPKYLTNNAFPIYLIHWFVLSFLGALMPYAVNSVLGSVFKGILGITISISIAELLRRMLPRFSKVLFGKR